MHTDGNHGLGIWVGTVTKEQEVSCFGWLRFGRISLTHDAEVTRTLNPQRDELQWIHSIITE